MSELALLGGADRFLRDPAEFEDADCERVSELLVGDIARVSDDKVELSIKVIGSAPIDKIDLFDGVDHLATYRTYSADDLGSHVRLTFSGAEYRGRSRTTNWDGSLEIDDNEIVGAEMFNNWNLDRGIQHRSTKTVSWKAVTSGNYCGVDLWLKNGAAGRLKVDTKHAQLEVPISELSVEGTKVEAGGLERRMTAQRLPDQLDQRIMEISQSCRVHADRDARLYIRVQQIDGHRAWTSPIYLFR